MSKYWTMASIRGPSNELPTQALVRCLLAIAALASTLIPFDIPGRSSSAFLPLSYGYSLYSVILCILIICRSDWFSGPIVLLTDVTWCALMLFFGSGSIYVLLIFLFTISATALQYGYAAGRGVTLICSAMVFLSAYRALTFDTWPNAAWPTTFVLGVGCMVSKWAEQMIQERRRLTLLVNVSRISNPRFGVDHTTNNIMQLIAQYYGASSCLLVLREPENSAWTMRTWTHLHAPSGKAAQRIDDNIATAMMAFGPCEVVVFRRDRIDNGGLAEQYVYDTVKCSWVRSASTAGAAISDMLETNAFISVPVPLRSGAGRMFIIGRAVLDKADAEFLAEIVSNAFPVVENIRLLDRLASSAANREREKIARDLHDSFLQPYIGLHHALRAISNKVDTDNPLLNDIRKLSAMTSNVIVDLRHLAGTMRRRSELDETAFVTAMIGHTERLKQFYGLDIAVHVDGDLGINDRMAMEIFQIVCEGTSNIRKHTASTRGSVTLKCIQGWLNLRIENECPGEPDREFLPRSICERAAALGGSTCVERLGSGTTAVRVDIPV